MSISRSRILGLCSCMAVWLTAVCCTVDQEQIAPFDPPNRIEFKVLDGVDHGIARPSGNGDYVKDRVSVQVMEGPIDRIVLLYSTDGGLSYGGNVDLLDGDGDLIFDGEMPVVPYPTHWFVGARSFSLNTSTEYGSVENPFLAQKYLSREEANATIRDQLATLRSRGQFATLLPEDLTTQHPYSFLVSGNQQEVMLDHYVDFFTSDVQHARYGIEYTELLDANGQPIREEKTPTFEALEANPVQDLGYVIISSANTDRLKEVLLEPQFFPETDRKFLEVIYY